MKRGSGWFLVVGAAATVACGGVAPSPTGQARSALSGGSSIASPNSVRYRDEGAHPATGRSGSAAIEARALVDKAGLTDLEVTTGQLDTAAAAPGNLEKLQLKTLDGAGDVLGTTNYNGLHGGGALDYQYTNLPHATPLQVQTNIGGIDPRTDVITTQIAVKYRPDLSPTRLDHPARAPVNSTVDINVAVAELMGDTGATADCVLSVDGAAVDHVRGFWVDAGDSVSCHFAHVFTAVGTHALRVDVANVVPGDYDLSNNSVAGTIEIYANESFYYWANAWSNSSQTDNVDDFYNAGASTPSDHSHRTWRNVNVFTRFYGRMSHAIAWPVQSVTLNEFTDGKLYSSNQYANRWWGRWWGNWYGGNRGCLYSYDFGGYGSRYGWFRMCSYDFGNGNGFTWVDRWRNSGSTTYHSDGFCDEAGAAVGFGECSSGNWTWNYDWSWWRWNYGGQTNPLGSTYDLKLDVVDATGTDYSAAPHINLQTRSGSWDSGYNCAPGYLGATSGKSCSEQSNEWHNAWGSASNW